MLFRLVNLNMDVVFPKFIVALTPDPHCTTHHIRNTSGIANAQVSWSTTQLPQAWVLTQSRADTTRSSYAEPNIAASTTVRGTPRFQPRPEFQSKPRPKPRSEPRCSPMCSLDPLAHSFHLLPLALLLFPRQATFHYTVEPIPDMSNLAYRSFRWLRHAGHLRSSDFLVYALRPLSTFMDSRPAVGSFFFPLQIPC
jgi:hypothetical protein